MLPTMMRRSRILANLITSSSSIWLTALRVCSFLRCDVAVEAFSCHVMTCSLRVALRWYVLTLAFSGLALPIFEDLLGSQGLARLPSLQ